MYPRPKHWGLVLTIQEFGGLRAQECRVWALGVLGVQLWRLLQRDAIGSAEHGSLSGLLCRICAGTKVHEALKFNQLVQRRSLNNSEGCSLVIVHDSKTAMLQRSAPHTLFRCVGMNERSLLF